ncbi:MULTISPECIES: amidase domain-containing protein [unclassified Cryobacterium]|uniref:amidase domain-containing protein n=1 Tax=unclassified Cryobacterium TaxID=2649013 RepID=UPI00141A7AD1|nr:MULTISPECIES: amidase domain-containing protein [unclassified Cryobacterium]
MQAQLSYALAHWKDYNTDQYGVVTGNDCVNFTSQSLVARGWAMDETWWTSGTGSDFDFSSPWVSSTAFMNYLADSGRATALTDDQRDQVKLGDVVQFDWDNTGDRDHTAVVSRIEGTGDDIVIYYAGHTDDTDYLSVDVAITEKHPGGTAYYWSIP